MEAQRKSLKENLAQLKEKLQRDRHEALREQIKILEHKMKVSLAIVSGVADGDCPGK